MMPRRTAKTAYRSLLATALTVASTVAAGPYSAPADDPTALDAPIPGFIGPHGAGMARLEDPYGGEAENPDNYVNPLFFSWAEAVEAYQPAPGVGSGWMDPSYALGPVTGEVFDVVTLGDLTASQVTGGTLPGSITLRLARAVANLPGADFAVFENGFVAENTSAGNGSVAGQFSADLGFVEVSSDGTHFARLPSRSLTAAPVNPFGTVVASNVLNLAGKHANSYGRSWGTPVDLADLADDPLVLGGQVDLAAIAYVRIVDVPGTGQFADATGAPIYDPSVTLGSGGFDLEAIGAIAVPVDFAAWQEIHNLTGRPAQDDSDDDGTCDLLEAALGRDPNRRDHEPPTTMTTVGGTPVFTFTRDSRMVGCTIEVQASTGLDDWDTIARSVAGGPLLPVAPHSPLITDTSAAAIRSIGVIRRHTIDLGVHSGPSARFYRLVVTPLSP